MTTTMDDGGRAPRRRSSKRSERKAEAGGLRQLPWRRITNPYKPLEILSEDQVEAIHEASLQILEEMGLEFMSSEALELLKRAGAEVDFSTQMVRFDRALIEEYLAKAPSRVTLTPRNPERQVVLGEGHVAFNLVAGPPFVHDRETGRRDGSYGDLCDLLRLAQSLKSIHMVGNQPVAPIELPAETRHLDCYLANVTYTDRVFSCTAIGAERALDGIEVMAIARGMTREAMIQSPGVITNINVNSPRRVDAAMADGLIAMSRHGQAISVTPFTLMGAMTPVTLAGALVQQNAEALGTLALTQIVRPGTPVVYGAFTSNVDMRSGAPAFGTPENAKATLAAGQLARRYDLPYRASNANASNVADAQAAYESQMSIWSSIMGGANYLMHGAGWLEGGLLASYEKLVLDAEMLQMIAETLVPVKVDAAELALEAIREVAPGGHFFGSPHTMARYERAFYEPMVSDWTNHEAWAEAGATTATERATKIWKRLLADYQAPPLDPAIREELEAFVSRRKQEIIRQLP
jgi:trimethylamine--corrinoid protein Co-methyltransferase